MLPSRSPPCCPITPQPWTRQPRGSFLSRTRRMPRPVASRHGGGAPRDRDSRSRRWGRSPILLTLYSTASDAVRGWRQRASAGAAARTRGVADGRSRCPGACRARRAPAAPVASACPTRPSRPRAPRLPSGAQAQPGLPPVAVLRRHPRRMQIRSQRVTLRRPGHQPRDRSPNQHQPEPRPQCLVPHRPSLLAPNPHATGRKKVARNSRKQTAAARCLAGMRKPRHQGGVSGGQFLVEGCRRPDLNQRPRAYESPALPLSYVGAAHGWRHSRTSVEILRNRPAGCQGRAQGSGRLFRAPGARSHPGGTAGSRRDCGWGLVPPPGTH